MKQKGKIILNYSRLCREYYLPANDDIKIDRAMKSVFNKITDFVFCQALFPKKSVRIPNVINLKAEDIYS